MAEKQDITEWWTKTLIGQQRSAHPVFGRKVRVSVDGSVVTLTGKVESAKEVEQIEREALAVPTVDKVVNHLTVTAEPDTYHWQTVIAVFPNQDAASLACQAADAAKVHGEETATIVDSPDLARQVLLERAQRAGVEGDRIQRYIDDVDRGKVVCVDRVPEDDALRIISAFEGAGPESVQTLPPEPDLPAGK